MKLREILSKVKPPKKDDWNRACVEEFKQELDLYSNEVKWDSFQVYEVMYKKWYCTDTYVGETVYFFNDKPVCISKRSGRKSNFHFYWISKDSRKAIVEHIQEITEDEDNSEYITEDDLNKEYGTGFSVNYSSQIIGNTCFYEGKKCTIVEKFYGYDNIKEWGTVVIELSNGDHKKVGLEGVLLEYSFDE